MSTLYLTNAAAIAACNAVVDLIDAGAGAGTLKIYDGTPPADADTALSGNTLLATLTFSDPAFGNAADATGKARATASSITGDTSADASGTATFFRVLDSNALVIMQGDVTATSGGGVLELGSTTISAGVQVDVTSFTYDVNELYSA